MAVIITAVVPTLAAVAEAVVSWESAFWVLLRQLGFNQRVFSSMSHWLPGRFFSEDPETVLVSYKYLTLFSPL